MWSARAPSSTTSNTFMTSSAIACSQLAEPGPEFLHVPIGTPRQPHAERKNDVIPDAEPGDAAIDQLVGNGDVQVPVVRHALPHPVALATEVDIPLAAVLPGHRPSHAQANARRGLGILLQLPREVGVEARPQIGRRGRLAGEVLGAAGARLFAQLLD